MAATSAPADRLTVALLYVSGVVQGLALVTFPAASAIFTSPTGFHLTGAEYGNMFIPQVLLAIIASAGGPLLAQRLGLRGVLLLGLGSDCLSMALLAACHFQPATAPRQQVKRADLIHCAPGTA